MPENSEQNYRRQPDPKEVEEARAWLREREMKGMVRGITGKFGAEGFIPIAERDSETQK